MLKINSLVHLRHLTTPSPPPITLLATSSSDRIACYQPVLELLRTLHQACCSQVAPQSSVPAQPGPPSASQPPQSNPDEEVCAAHRHIQCAHTQTQTHKHTHTYTQTHKHTHKHTHMHTHSPHTLAYLVHPSVCPQCSSRPPWSSPCVPRTPCCTSPCTSG